MLGSLGKGFVIGDTAAVKDPTCTKGKALKPEQAAQNGAYYLAGALAKTGHLDSPPMPGAEDSAPQPDFGNTADAVVALSASGHKDKAEASAKWLAENSAAWAKENGPAAYAQLVMAAHATGADVHDFGGADLVSRLNATGPEPAAVKKPTAAATQEEEKKDSGDGDGIGGVWWFVGIGLAVGAGAGFLISGRRKNQQL